MPSSTLSQLTRRRASLSAKCRTARVDRHVCNLYALNKKRDMVARFFRASHNRSAAFEPLTAIFPGHTAPVVRCSADGEREVVLMSWGFRIAPERARAKARHQRARRQNSGK